MSCGFSGTWSYFVAFLDQCRNFSKLCEDLFHCTVKPKTFQEAWTLVGKWNEAQDCRQHLSSHLGKRALREAQTFCGMTPARGVTQCGQEWEPPYFSKRRRPDRLFLRIILALILAPQWKLLGTFDLWFSLKWQDLAKRMLSLSIFQKNERINKISVSADC